MGEDHPCDRAAAWGAFLGKLSVIINAVPQTSQADPTAELAAGPEAEILHRATEVIGSKVEAMRWMGTPIRVLNYATPVSLLHTRKGREAVLSVLGRLEHGVL